MARVVSEQCLAKIEELCRRYPTRAAALIPALHLVQREQGHLSAEAQLDVAEALDVPPTQVREVVTFYTMFSDKPVGKHTVRICRNLACQLRGADRIMAKAKEVLGVKCGETTSDGSITLEHEECLAACGTGPVLHCDDEIVENLTEDKLERFLESLRN